MDKTLLTYNLNVFSLLYLSSAFQSNVGCFMVGPPIVVPDVLCILSAQAFTMVWIATLVASATALAIASFIICSYGMIYSPYLIFFALLTNFFTPDTM